MRKFLLLLILINLGFFVVHQLYDKPAVAADATANDEYPRYPRLALVNEAVGDESQLMTAAAEGALCVRVGPFEHLLQAEYFQERLSAEAVSSEIKDMPSERHRALQYQVNLILTDNYGSVDVNMTLLYQLQQAGLDAYLAEEGVSLGIFANPEAAKKVLIKAEQQGFPAEIFERHTDETERWVIPAVREMDKLDKKQWNSLVHEFPGVEKQYFSCLSVASPGKFL